MAENKCGLKIPSKACTFQPFNVDISVQRPQLLAAFFPAERGASPHINLNRLSTRWRILVLAGEMIGMLETAIKSLMNMVARCCKLQLLLGCLGHVPACLERGCKGRAMSYCSLKNEGIFHREKTRDMK